MDKQKNKNKVLFGGEKLWHENDWTASDDRVRGGKSISELKGNGHSAEFTGTLDTTALGGAGFASQRTKAEDQTWDLSKYSGIQLDLHRWEGTVDTFTFILKDKLLPKDPDTGREQATISWEYDFTAKKLSRHKRETQHVVIPWSSFKPTYRGKKVVDAGPMDIKNIRRFSIMCRSFFGKQEGYFDLFIDKIEAIAPPLDLEGSFPADIKEPFSDLEKGGFPGDFAEPLPYLENGFPGDSKKGPKSGSFAWYEYVGTIFVIGCILFVVHTWTCL